MAGVLSATGPSRRDLDLDLPGTTGRRGQRQACRKKGPKGGGTHPEDDRHAVSRRVHGLDEGIPASIQLRSQGPRDPVDQEATPIARRLPAPSEPTPPGPSPHQQGPSHGEGRASAAAE
jgi:hypothetical protein